jgi:hypothetical protein
MAPQLSNSKMMEKAYYGEKEPSDSEKAKFAAIGAVGPQKLRQIVQKMFRHSIPLKEVKEWIDKQSIYQRTKQPRKAKKGVHHYYITEPDALHETDILYVIPSRGKAKGSKQYILGVIDGMSRLLAMIPMAERNQDEALDGFKQIYEGKDSPLNGHFPKVLASDNRGEFKNATLAAYLKQHDVKQHFRRPKAHAKLIERVFSGIQRRLYAAVDTASSRKTFRWDEDLASIVHTYNNTPHTSLSGPSSLKDNGGGRTPQEVFDAGKLDSDAPISNPQLPKAAQHKPVFVLGQQVQKKILGDRGEFKAGDFRWSETPHVITDVRKYSVAAGRPNCYHVDNEDHYWLHENDLLPYVPEEKEGEHKVISDEEIAKYNAELQAEFSKARREEAQPMSTAELGPEENNS